MNALRSSASTIARRRSALSKGGLSRLTIRLLVALLVRNSQIACGAWLLTSFSSGTVTTKGQVMSNLPETKARSRCRAVRDDRVFDAVEIGPILFPIVRIAGHRDQLVRLELDEFERAGPDRMAAHFCRRHVAGIDRRIARREQRDQRRLRPFEVEDRLVIARRRNLLDVMVPFLARIDPQPVLSTCRAAGRRCI